MLIKYILLGIIQGLTEFLPVSSSGHLVIMQKLFGMHGNEVAISVVLHLGTCLALVIYFFKDIIKLIKDKKNLILIAIVTVITGIMGLSGKDFFEGLFSSSRAVALALVFTGLMLIVTKKFMDGKRNKPDTKDALVLGFMQGFAIIPGISRSGTTISTLLFRGIKRETAFRFSFLAAIPAILGAALLEAKDISFAAQGNLKNFVAGFIFSFLAGLFSLWLLRLMINKAKLYYFGYYCIVIAVLTYIFIR